MDRNIIWKIMNDKKEDSTIGVFSMKMKKHDNHNIYIEKSGWLLPSDECFLIISNFEMKIINF